LPTRGIPGSAIVRDIYEKFFNKILTLFYIQNISKET